SSHSRAWLTRRRFFIGFSQNEKGPRERPLGREGSDGIRRCVRAAKPAPLGGLSRSEATACPPTMVRDDGWWARLLPGLSPPYGPTDLGFGEALPQQWQHEFRKVSQNETYVNCFMQKSATYL